MRTFDLIKKKKFKNSTLLASTTSERKVALSFLSDFCWNKNKNKPKQPLLYSLFQDSKRTSTSTETNNTSYESPNTQLLGARRTRAWHYHGEATPTSCKMFATFSF